MLNIIIIIIIMPLINKCRPIRVCTQVVPYTHWCSLAVWGRGVLLFCVRAPQLAVGKLFLQCPGYERCWVICVTWHWLLSHRSTSRGPGWYKTCYTTHKASIILSPNSQQFQDSHIQLWL